LFARPELKKSVDLGTLPFPFSVINGIMKGDRIVSIVSASANNEIAYKERHQGFEEYIHPCKMDLGEICAAFKGVATRKDHKRILEVTGGVPWQVKKLISSKFSFDDYEEAELCTILSSLKRLKLEKPGSTFQDITSSAVACVLSTKGDEIEYDRKYSISVKGKKAYDYEPLFPAVILAYRRYFWNKILVYVHTHEKQLLKVCANHGLTNSACGQIFELLVISRCSRNANVTWDGFLLKKCSLIETFCSNTLPEVMVEDGMYVPRNCNFPAIDLIWKCGKSVYGVQVHTSDHHNVLKKFTKMCNAAGWHKMFTKIFLIYLSPRQSISDSVKSNIPQTQGKITVVAVCKSSIPCLTDLQWPDLK